MKIEMTDRTERMEFGDLVVGRAFCWVTGKGRMGSTLHVKTGMGSFVSFQDGNVEPYTGSAASPEMRVVPVVIELIRCSPRET